MAIIRPFCALRPVPQRASAIASLPYDVVSTNEARTMVQDNPYSFLYIDRPEINFSEPIDPYAPEVYQAAYSKLQQMISSGNFISDNQECLYVYRQIMQGRVQTGLVCCTSVDDYLRGIIKKHEHTRPDKELDRTRHIAAVKAHTGPILQTYKDQPHITELITHWVESHTPIYQFQAFGVEQICWRIDDYTTITELQALFAEVPSLYIADGHHRSAAAIRTALTERQKNPNFSGNEAYNYFLSVIFPASELQILPYNRVVRDIAGLSPQAFLAAVEQYFDVQPAPAQPYQPEAKHLFGMYLEQQWYQLRIKKDLVPDDPVQSLDVSLLQNYLLSPILHIADPRTDERIEFIGGNRGLAELEQRVGTNISVAFSLYPTSINDVMQVADAGLIMPPKSTWFEPKLLSGLFIHQIER